MKYRTIVADPPWPMGKPHGRRSGKSGNWVNYDDTTSMTLPYEQMSLADIRALPVSEYAEDNCHLYLWAVSKYLPDAYQVAMAWGFKVGMILTWCKAPMGLGMGGAFTSTTEFVLVAKRGRLPHVGRVHTSWFQWKRGKHSEKPQAFLDIVESVSPGPYLEMFARQQRMGWDTWGNECYMPAHLDNPPSLERE